MQKKTIEHPFRKITFDFDECKQWTPRDEKLLKLYLKIHDSEAKQQAAARELMKKYGALDRQVTEVRTRLKKVKDTFAATREAADHVLAEVNLRKRNALEKFVQRVNDTNDIIQEYDKKIRELEKEIKELSTEKEQFHNEEEDNPLWRRLSELKITYAYDSRMAIDYVSFDGDEERLREKTTFISRQNDNHINFCDRVVENYNRLLLETTTQYELWSEFGKRMMLIQQISSQNSGFTEISGN